MAKIEIILCSKEIKTDLDINKIEIKLIYPLEIEIILIIEIEIILVTGIEITLVIGIEVILMTGIEIENLICPILEEVKIKDFKGKNWRRLMKEIR